MSIDLHISAHDEHGRYASRLLEVLSRGQQYQGRTLSEISTALWGSICLCKSFAKATISFESLPENDITCSGEDLYGAYMGLCWILCDEKFQPQRHMLLGNRQSPWVPVDGTIQWMRNASNDISIRYQKDSDETIHTFSNAEIESLIECLDVLSQIDHTFALLWPSMEYA